MAAVLMSLVEDSRALPSGHESAEIGLFRTAFTGTLLAPSLICQTGSPAREAVLKQM
jgi:hypothetical protein